MSMSDSENTQEFSDSSGPINADPLGIIGWEIGGKYKIRGYIGGGGFGGGFGGFGGGMSGGGGASRGF